MEQGGKQQDKGVEHKIEKKSSTYNGIDEGRYEQFFLSSRSLKIQ
jgi:hypothetical protein